MHPVRSMVLVISSALRREGLIADELVLQLATSPCGRRAPQVRSPPTALSARSGSLLPGEMSRGRQSVDPPPERGVQVGSIMFDGRDATLISGHLKPADRRIDAPPLPRISGAQGGYAFEKARPKNIEKWDL
jgi:hypothetical protein